MDGRVNCMGERMVRLCGCVDGRVFKMFVWVEYMDVRIHGFYRFTDSLPLLCWVTQEVHLH